MGARGPKPLPANVHMLRGNPSKLAAGALIDTLQPEIEVPGCPPHLMPEAKKEWRRITPELERYGLVSKLDRAALALYCQSWAQLVYAEKQLARAARIADLKRQAHVDACIARAVAAVPADRCDGPEALEAARREAAAQAGSDADATWTGGDGWLVMTPNGHQTYSPYWVMANRAREQVDKFLAAFGLSPSSRGRVNPSNLRQRGLFDEPGASGFGDL